MASSDTTIPIITLNGSATMEIIAGDSFTDPGATVNDNIDQDLQVVVTGTVDTSTPGEYTLKYNALDSAGNSALEVIRTVTVTAATNAIIDGYISIYLGEFGTGLNNICLNQLNQATLNSVFSAMKFTLKSNEADSGIGFNGSDVIISDQNGNLAAIVNNIVHAHFRIATPDASKNLLVIGDMGYLNKKIPITLTVNHTATVGTESQPIELIPGDIGTIVTGTGLVLEPDGIVNNIDFSAWLKIFKEQDTTTSANLLRADLSRNEVVDNVDFSLWLSAFKKLPTIQY